MSSKKSWYPKPYNTNSGRKKAASVFQEQIVVNFEVSLTLLQGISHIDTLLYSEKTRNDLYELVASISDKETLLMLKDSELTRKNLYRPQDFYDESHYTDPSKISHV